MCSLYATAQAGYHIDLEDENTMSGAPDFFRISEQLGSLRASLELLSNSVKDLQRDTKDQTKVLNDLNTYTHDLRHDFSSNKTGVDSAILAIDKNLKQSLETSRNNNEKLNDTILSLDNLKDRFDAIEKPIHELLTSKKYIFWFGGVLVVIVSWIGYLLHPVWESTVTRFFNRLWS